MGDAVKSGRRSAGGMVPKGEEVLMRRLAGVPRHRDGGLGLVLGIGLLFGGESPCWAEATADPDDWASHTQRAEQLMVVEQYPEAIKELEAAFAIHAEPRLLYLQGVVQQRMGNSTEAYTLLQRFVVASVGVGSLDEKRDASQRIEELRQQLARVKPAPKAALTPVPETPFADLVAARFRFEDRKGHRGMLAAGGILISLGYAFACGFGLAFALGSDYRSAPGQVGTRALGATLLIPGVGPIVSTLADYQNFGSWGLPWLLLDLPATVIGVGLIVQGTRTKQLVLRPLQPVKEAALFRPYFTPDGAGMLVVGRY